MMTLSKTLILTVASTLLLNSCVARPLGFERDPHRSFPSNIEHNLNKLGWYRGASESDIICLYYAGSTMAANWPDRHISDKMLSDGTKNSNVERWEGEGENEEKGKENEAAKAVCSEKCGSAYPDAIIPGEKVAALAAKVANPIVAAPVEATSVGRNKNAATSATTPSSNARANQSAVNVGHSIKVRKPTLSFARRTHSD